jgi:hypothetical protein
MIVNQDDHHQNVDEQYYWSASWKIQFMNTKKTSQNLRRTSQPTGGNIHHWTTSPGSPGSAFSDHHHWVLPNGSSQAGWCDTADAHSIRPWWPMVTLVGGSCADGSCAIQRFIEACRDKLAHTRTPTDPQVADVRSFLRMQTSVALGRKWHFRHDDPGPEDTGYNLTLGGRSFRHRLHRLLDATWNLTGKSIMSFHSEVICFRTNYWNMQFRSCNFTFLWVYHSMSSVWFGYFDVFCNLIFRHVLDMFFPF